MERCEKKICFRQSQFGRRGGKTFIFAALGLGKKQFFRKRRVRDKWEYEKKVFLVLNEHQNHIFRRISGSSSKSERRIAKKKKGDRADAGGGVGFLSGPIVRIKKRKLNPLVRVASVVSING